MRLVVATCQFPVDGNISANLAFVERQMKRACRLGAHVAHFSESSLSGYAEREFKSFARYNWEQLTEATQQIARLAKKLRLWVVLGSNHRLSGAHKPHNCLYVIDNLGKIADRYDKRFCTGNAKESRNDLKHYTPGDHFVVVTIRGVRCGFLICYDYRFPELYREYKRHGVQMVFHSFHQGHFSKAELRHFRNIWSFITPATMQAHAATNHLWISVNNTSRRESSWPSFFVQPDGTITGRLKKHRAGILLSTVDTRQKIYDAPANWRSRAMNGVYHSGTLVADQRSRDRTAL